MDEDGHAAMQLDSDDEQDEAQQPRRRGARQPVLALDILQVLAGRAGLHFREPQAAPSDAALLDTLKRNGMLTSDAVYAAMLEVPRSLLVPAAYKREAHIDTPIRLEEQDVNISAPHMHAQMLERVELAPGDRLLDVGCGCGLLAACAAYMVGRNGAVMGVDIKPYCTTLCTANEAALRATNPRYAAAAAPIEWREANIFLLARKLKGRFNKVLVGATCPEAAVGQLFSLLPDSGGLLLVPVDTDLRLYKKEAGGKASMRTVSSVRFQDLEVPSQSQVVLAALAEEAAARLVVTVSPPRLAADLRGTGSPASPTGRTSSNASSMSGCLPLLGRCLSGSSHSSSSSHAMSRSPPDVTSHPPPPPAGPQTNSLGRTSSGSGSGSRPSDPCGSTRRSSGSGSEGAGEEEGCGVVLREWWGQQEPDVVLVGQGWELAAHKAVLRGRCELFRAQLSSGMSDAECPRHAVAEDFSRAALEVVLHYAYADELPTGVEPALAAEVARAACYYGCPRLAELCEQHLAAALLALDPATAAAEAPALLHLASVLGLQQLKRVAAAYCAQHHAQVCQAEAYKGLSQDMMEAVVDELVREVGLLKGLVQEPEVPQPPPGDRLSLFRRLL